MSIKASGKTYQPTLALPPAPGSIYASSTVTAKPPALRSSSIQPSSAKAPSCQTKLIHWIRKGLEEKASFAHKAASVATIFFGSLLLLGSVLGIPLFFSLVKECIRQEREDAASLGIQKNGTAARRALFSVSRRPPSPPDTPPTTMTVSEFLRRPPRAPHFDTDPAHSLEVAKDYYGVLRAKEALEARLMAAQDDFVLERQKETIAGQRDIIAGQRRHIARSERTLKTLGARSLENQQLLDQQRKIIAEAGETLDNMEAARQAHERAAQTLLGQLAQKDAAIAGLQNELLKQKEASEKFYADTSALFNSEINDASEHVRRQKEKAETRARTREAQIAHLTQQLEDLTTEKSALEHTLAEQVKSHGARIAQMEHVNNQLSSKLDGAAEHFQEQEAAIDSLEKLNKSLLETQNLLKKSLADSERAREASEAREIHSANQIVAQLTQIKEQEQEILRLSTLVKELGSGTTLAKLQNLLTQFQNLNKKQEATIATLRAELENNSRKHVAQLEELYRTIAQLEARSKEQKVEIARLNTLLTQAPAVVPSTLSATAPPASGGGRPMARSASLTSSLQIVPFDRTKHGESVVSHLKKEFEELPSKMAGAAAAAVASPPALPESTTIDQLRNQKGKLEEETTSLRRQVDDLTNKNAALQSEVGFKDTLVTLMKDYDNYVKCTTAELQRQQTTIEQQAEELSKTKAELDLAQQGAQQARRLFLNSLGGKPKASSKMQSGSPATPPRSLSATAAPTPSTVLSSPSTLLHSMIATVATMQQTISSMGGTTADTAAAAVAHPLPPATAATDDEETF